MTRVSPYALFAVILENKIYFIGIIDKIKPIGFNASTQWPMPRFMNRQKFGDLKREKNYFRHIIRV